jgi:hypothetical protein
MTDAQTQAEFFNKIGATSPLTTKQLRTEVHSISAVRYSRGEG